MERETGKLLDYGVIAIKGETNYRISQTIKHSMVLCDTHAPTFVFIEGIQIQRNPKVYEILAKLQGTMEIILEEKGYFVNVVKASEWRKRVGVKGRKRVETKASAIQMVKELYDIEPSEDECEAILFARAFSID